MPTLPWRDHWIKEHVPGVWALEHALLGFMQIKCSHSGVHLGQMLYKIINQLQFHQKARTFTLSDHCLAHLLLVYRSATLHVITRRIIPLCCKSLCSAINLRPGPALMSNAGRSGGHSILYHTNTVHRLVPIDASLILSIWQPRLSSLHAPSQCIIMGTPLAIISLMT